MKVAMLALTALLVHSQVPHATADLLDKLPEHVHKSTVIVHTLHSQKMETHKGTGVVVAERIKDEGWVILLTARHIVDSGDIIFVNFPLFEGDSFVRDRSKYDTESALLGKVIRKSDSSDLAAVLVEIPKQKREGLRKLRAVKLAQKDQCSTGIPFFIVGDNKAKTTTPDAIFFASEARLLTEAHCRIDVNFKVDTGPFQNRTLKDAGRQLLVISYTGFSGGPVLDAAGKLIGIVTGGAGHLPTSILFDHTNPSPFTFTVSFDQLQYFMKEVKIGMHVAIGNESNSNIRYRLIFDQDDLRAWEKHSIQTRDWLNLSVGDCRIHGKHYSLKELARQSRRYRYPVGFEETERGRYISWKVKYLEDAEPKAKRELIRSPSVSGGIAPVLFEGGCRGFGKIHRRQSGYEHQIEYG